MLPGLGTGVSTAVRPRPPLFRALGTAEVPQTIEISSESYQLVKVFKHDSWAATAMYSGRSGTVVCKFNRQQSIGLLPMRWLGRRLARHEAAILRRLEGLSNIPRWLGDVSSAGKKLPYAVAHDYIPGHPLRAHEIVDDDFFARFRQVLAGIHRSDMAYVDLHKRENILVGDDGEPYLFDFQISFVLPSWWPANGLWMRAILNMLQRSDDYHLTKHERRNLRDPHESNENYQPPEPPWWIRIHRKFAQPFRSVRRWLLVQLRIRNGNGRSTSEYFPEEAVQIERDAAVNLSCSPNIG